MQQPKTDSLRHQQYPDIIDPFDSIPIPGAAAETALPYNSNAMGCNSILSAPDWMPQSAPHVHAAAPDWFGSFDASNTTQSRNYMGNQSGLHNCQHNRGSNQLSSPLNNADMDLFKY